jgi:cyclase
VSPYQPEGWQGPKDSVATVFYRWQADDWQPES